LLAMRFTLLSAAKSDNRWLLPKICCRKIMNRISSTTTIQVCMQCQGARDG